MTPFKLVGLVSLGGALEFFDFTIYALFASYISVVFFPQEKHWIALVNTFVIFALGYLARPLGGFIFGHLGDKQGRKNAFTFSALIMASATLLIGCLPGYQQIGVLAPFLLLICRLLQGLSVGGEIPGATVFVVEHFAKRKRGWAVALIFAAVTFGNVLGGAMGWELTRILSKEQMLSWGWRLPFIAGFFLGLLAFVIRQKLLETPIFLELLKQEKTFRIPAVKLFKTALPQFIQGAGLTALSAATIVIFLYLPTYLPMHAHLPANEAYFINVISFVLFSISTAFFGFISDYVSPRKLSAAGAILAAIAGYFLFANLNNPTLNNFLWLGIGLAVTVGMVNGCYGQMIAELFPAPIRYSGMGISFSLGLALFSGLAPLIITTLLKFIPGPLASYLFFLSCCLMTLLSVIHYKHSSEDGVLSMTLTPSG